MTKWKGTAASFAPNVAELFSCGSRRSAPAILTAALIAAFSASTASAADRYWDVNGPAAGSGGAGTWDLGNLYWSPNASDTAGPYDQPWNNGALDHAIFGGMAGTVTLGVPITANALTFDTSGYTLSGSTLTLAGATPTITATGGTSTISAIIAGSAGLTKAGVGTLVLAGANTFSGDLVVNDGVVRAGSTQAFGTGWMSVNSGTLDLAGFNNSISGLTGAGTVTLGSGTLTLAQGLGWSFSGAISGSGGLTKGSGYGFLSGCGGTYTGATTIQGGMLSVNCISNGGLASGIGASGADASNLILSDGGELEYTGGTVTTDRGFHLASDWASIRVSQATTTLEFTGDVTSANSGSLDKNGSGTLKLSGTNNFTNTKVAQGTLIAGSNQAFGSGTLYVFAGATADMTGFSNTVGALSDFGAGGEIRIGAQTLTVSDGGHKDFTGQITGTTGQLVKNGTARQILIGCDSSYGGRTVINDGALAVACLNNGGVNSSIGSSTADAGNLVIGSTAAGILEYIGTGSSTDRLFTMGNTATIRNNGTGALNFTNTAAVAHSGAGTRQLRLGGANTGANILAAQIVDNGASAVSVIKEDAGTWRLSSLTSTYTGTTTIDAGTLEVSKLSNGGLASSLGTSSAAAGNLLIATNAGLRYVGAGDSTDRLFALGTGTTRIESSGSGAINFTGTGGTMGFSGIGARTFTLGGTYAGDNIMGATILDQSGIDRTSLTKNDAGTWILTAANTYTGNTVINGGKLVIGNSGTTGTVGTGAVSLASSTGTLGFNRSDTFTFGGVISGSGIIEQMGEGTTVLTAANSAGATRITEGALQVNGDLTTDTITFSGDEATTLIVNGTVQGNGVPTVITGDGSSNIITVNAGGTLTATGDLGGGSDTVTVSGMLNTVADTLGLGSGADTLVLNDGGAIAGGVTGGAGTDILQVNNAALMTLQAGSFSGFEALNKTLAGTLTLIGDHSYSAGTTIAAGTLQIGNGATAGSLTTPTLQNEGTLAFNLNSNYSFAGLISGGGAVQKLGTGVTTLTGDNSYKGATTVTAGTLIVDGDQSGATGLTSVGALGTLGGNGIVGGDVTVAGTLAPGAAGNAAGELTINGGLTLDSTAKVNVDFGQANVVGGLLNDLITVGGDLTLDGTLNVTQTPGGSFGPGVYRIFDYGGTLTDNGLTVADPDYFVQTAVDKQVNLVNSAGLALSFWDGNAGPHSNSAIEGGDGTWRAADDQNWTDSTGLFAAPFANGSFAIFQGAAGTVTVDNTDGQVEALGMQFATGGYRVEGAGIVLLDDTTQPGLQSVIRVGDGTPAGENYIATIAADLAGATQLVKTDLGTLVLSGTNTYTGGTVIEDGVLQISSDANLGAAGGVLSMNSGTLRNTAAVASSRTVTLNAAGGTLETLDTLTLDGTVGGTGALTKTGAGTLVLNGTNTYQGGTVINVGTVQVSANANLGNAAGALTFDGGTLHSISTFTAARNVTLNAGGGTFDTDGFMSLTLANAVNGAGALTKVGTGTLVLANANTYGGGTTILEGTLQLGNGNAAGSIMGDVFNDGTLAFNRSDSYSFAGLISGTGGLVQFGTGTTVLSADNSYTGATSVSAGALYINGDQSSATGTVTVNAGTLGGNGIIGGDVFINAGATLAPGDIGFAPGTLTINGDLVLAAGANLDYVFGQAGAVGGAYNDLTVVHGDLRLDGTINVAEAPGGNFGPGIYRIISYDGALDDQGLDTTSTDYRVQTAIAQQVNLVSTAGLVLNYWDGDTDPVNQSNGAIEGGNGIWRAGGAPLWTQSDGGLNGIFDSGAFAVFAGNAGTVTVDDTFGAITVAGLQFATDGYAVQSGEIVLDGPQATIRVGDNTLAGEAYTATIASALSGTGELVKTDLGTLVLSGTNSYSGGTTINGGTLQVSADINLGDAAGNLALDGGATLRNTAAFNSARDVTLRAGGGTFDTQADLTLSGQIGGTGALTKAGNGSLVLAGTNTYAGTTTVTAGGLYVDGDQTAATGPTTVQSGARLGGKGIIGGNVTIADGATLSPGAANDTPGTLAILGDLNLSGGSILAYSFGEANVAGGTLNDLTTVHGNLVLDGTLNVSVPAGGTFGPGVYRVFSYDGALVDNGLSIGTIPSAGFAIQTSIAKQVNLVNTAGLTFNYWDGHAGPKNDGVISGGNGVWQSSAGNDNWTNSSGVINAAFSDSAFAVFAGAAGTVTVDNSLGQVTTSGMQFMSDGYVVQDSAIELSGPSATIVVGDGTAAGASMTATISAQFSGASTLTKTDAGILVLSGTNTYTGGTAINGGTLRVSADGNLGAAAGALSFTGGTLNSTANMATAREIALVGAGTFNTNTATTLTLNGDISGAGALTKSGAGTLALAGDAAHTGGTSIEAGTLRVGDGASSGSLGGNVTNKGALVFDRADSYLFAGSITGTGTLEQAGSGTTILAGNSTYSGGTRVSSGTLQIGSGGTAGSISGNVVNNATLAFNRANTLTFAGKISGSGDVNQLGGMTVLAGNNSYAGATNVLGGALLINGDQSGATGATSVAASAVLGGNGVIGGDVTVADGASLSPGGAAGEAGTLTIKGDLTLGESTLDYNFGQANVVGGALNDHVLVAGDLVLDGTLNVAQTAGGSFAPGLYRIISYQGTLTDKGLALGSMPSGDFSVQTSFANEVNLVNTTGLVLNFWDGNAGPAFNNQVDGGDGIWRAAGDTSWTDSTGATNASYTNGAFAVFGGKTGLVTVDDSRGAISVTGLQFTTDGYVIQGDSFSLLGAQSIIRVGAGISEDASLVATIASDLSGSAELVKTDKGTLVLSGTNTYTGGTAINGGTLQVSADANLGDAAGALSFNGGWLSTTASFESGRDIDVLGAGTVSTAAGTTLTLNGALSGNGTLTKSGGGTLALKSDSSAFAGTTAIGEGTLDISGSLRGTIDVLSGGRLEGTGTVGDTTNATGGTIAAGNDGMPGTLTIAGDYTSKGGTLEIETVLGGDGSATDRLVVSGDTSGTTIIKVLNLGGGGAQTENGIKIIDVAGASKGSFSLAGDYLFEGKQAVVGGAYAYLLYKNGVATPSDGDWYLRSAYMYPSNPEPQPLYAPGAPLYEAYAGVLQRFNQLGSLQDRLGNRSWGPSATPQGADVPGAAPIDGKAVWARIEAAHDRLDPETSTTGADYDVTTWRLQAGVDGLLHESEAGVLIGGITVHYGTISSSVSSVFGTGAIDATGYGFGGTLTWYGDNGFYADVQAQATWYDSDLLSATLRTTLADGNGGFGHGLSIETGHRLTLTENWSLTPQAQLAYAAIDFNDFTDPFGARVALGNGDILLGRLGLSADYETQWVDQAGQVSRAHFYGIANLYYDFFDGSDVEVSGVSLVSENQALWGGIGIGGTLNWADGRYGAFGELSAQGSLANLGSSYSLDAKLGLGVKW